MPIRDYNDSVYYYERGRNMVWRDTAKYRHEINCPCNGPHSKALPYIPPYIKLLEGSSDNMKLLQFFTPLLTSGNPTSEEPLLPAIKSKHEIQKCENHVLPLPIVDAILSTAGKNWYYSPLRIQWARTALTKAMKEITENDLNSAAKIIAEIFGTLLPSCSIRDMEAEEEREMCHNAWKLLSNFVDPEFIFNGISKEVKGISREKEMSLTQMSYFAKARRIGPAALRIAEEIEEIEKEIAEVKNTIYQQSLTAYDYKNAGFEFYVHPIDEYGYICSLKPIEYWHKSRFEYVKQTGCIAYNFMTQKYCFISGSEKLNATVEKEGNWGACWFTFLHKYYFSYNSAPEAIIEGVQEILDKVGIVAAERRRKIRDEQIARMEKELNRLVSEFEIMEPPVEEVEKKRKKDY